jgi:hypothetical protein
MADKTRGDIFVAIRSRDIASTSSEDNNNAGTFTLFENINANEDEILSVKLVSATLPMSFLNLSVKNQNNYIDFKEDGDGSYFHLLIPDGTYNITELMAEIKTLLDANSSNGLTYTLTYSEINNKATIKASDDGASNSSFDFTGANSCRRMLGFTSAIKTITTAAGIVSDRGVDITDTKNSLYIRLPNMSNQKIIESSHGRYSNCIAQVPVVLGRNFYYTYLPPQEFDMELSQKQINSIDINITWQEETDPVDFNACDWEINLIISFHQLAYTERKRREHHSLSKMLINRVRDYHHQLMQDDEKTQKLNEFVKSNNLNLT